MTSPEQNLRGPFRFYRPDSGDLRRFFPEDDTTLPRPHPIFASDETSQPFVGFPILISPSLDSLREALQAYVQAEEVTQLELVLGRIGTRAPVEQAWHRYGNLLTRVTDNTTASSYGRKYPSIFWLFHSIAVARQFKETPKRLLARASEVERARADEIKYRAFKRFSDRVRQLTAASVRRTSKHTGEPEEEIFPALLPRMLDNILILTEDHVGADLRELDSYLSASIGIDARDFRTRLENLTAWHRRQIEVNPELRRMMQHVLEIDPDEAGDDLLYRPGHVRYLASLTEWNPELLPDPAQVEAWERLLLRLKEFEILLSWRRLIVPVQKEGKRLLCMDPTGPRPGQPVGRVSLARSTGTLDFTAPWVVDPVVHRYGLIYDMTNFAEIVSVLRQTGHDTQDTSFRSIFEFQRWVNRVARERRIKLEKYLGDGAFYSGRDPHPLVTTAILLQQHYARLLEQDFPLDQGMRIALNHGTYRLVPVDRGFPGQGDRYEFLGHGIVELSRLATGKATREIDEIKSLLINRGYSAGTVETFFAPMQHHDVDVVDKDEEARDFYAYIDSNGNLVNEGIVATRPFIELLDRGATIQQRRDGRRIWITLRLATPEALLVGIRRLGNPRFKGIADLEVFEVVDGTQWDEASLEPVSERSLVSALRRAQSSQISEPSRPRISGPPGDLFQG